jgi:aldehyde:ferredoxin oxidoreductase
LSTGLTCTRCPIRCRRVTASQGRFRFHVEGPDYAQLCAFGPNCDLVDVEAISYMNYLCYDLGLDPIEMGNTLAMLAEATERGAVSNGVAWAMRSGSRRCCAKRARDRANGAVSASAPPVPPRASASTRGRCQSKASRSRTSIRGPSPHGGCSTQPRASAQPPTSGPTRTSWSRCATWAVEPIVTPDSTPGEIAAAVKLKQDLVAALDAMTICAFSSYAFSLEDYAAALGMVTHTTWQPAALLDAGARIVDLERQCNKAWGIGASSDTLPERFLKEPVPSGMHGGKVCDLEPMLQAYYTLRGWPGGELPAERHVHPDAMPAVL